MIRIEFTEEEIKELHREHLHNSHPLVRKRCEAVYLKALGYPHQEIGHIVRISQPTLRGYLKTYQKGGLGKLKELNFYRPSSELDEYRDMLREEFEDNPPATINQAVERIEQLTGLRRSPTQVGQFMKKNLA